jgi:putative DNA primase/helicase
MMGTHPEQMLISAILRQEDFQTHQAHGITAEQVHDFRAEWDWLEDYFRAYDRTPTKTEFRHRFPDFAVKQVDNIAALCPEVQQGHKRHAQLALTNTLLDLLAAEDYDGAEAAIVAFAGRVNLNGQGRRVQIVRASDVPMRELSWLWQRWIPAEHFTAIAGDGGVGKGHLLVTLTACVTTGRPFPGDERPRPPMRVLLAGDEDAIDQVVIPRLLVAGADLDLVGFCKIADNHGPGLLSLPSDVGVLQAAIGPDQYGLVAIDSASSYLDRGLNANSDQDVRRALLPLARMAQDARTTVVASLHVNKKGDAAAGQRVLGAAAWRNVARSVLVAGKLPEDQGEGFGVLVEKNNLSAKPVPLGYWIEEARAIQRGIQSDTSRLVWFEQSPDVGADDLLPHRATTRGRPAIERDQAEAWLLEVLEPGPLPAEVLQAKAADQPFSWRTVETAKKELGIVAYQEGRKWWWMLPDGERQSATVP